MASYYINEAAFTLPDLGFVDRTVHVLEARLPGDDPLGLIVARQVVPAGKTLRQLVVEHLRSDARRLKGFVVIEELEIYVGRAAAIEVRSRWRHEGTVLYQRQAHLAASGSWLMFAMTAPLDQQAACDAALDQVLATLALRTD